METKNKVGIKGRLRITIKDKFGNYKKLWQENSLGDILKVKIPYITGKYATEYRKDNLIVNAGLAGVASRFNGDGGEAVFNVIAVGTGTAAVAATNTTLGAELTTRGFARATAVLSRTTTVVANDTARLVREFTVTAGTPTGNIAVSEVGIFNALSAGTMASRTVITTKNVDTGDKLEVTYTLQVTQI